MYKNFLWLIFYPYFYRSNKSRELSSKRKHSECLKCMMCGESVEDIRYHLRSTHKITMNIQLFIDMHETAPKPLKRNKNVIEMDCETSSSGFVRSNTLEKQPLQKSSSGSNVDMAEVHRKISKQTERHADTKLKEPGLVSTESSVSAASEASSPKSFLHPEKHQSLSSLAEAKPEESGLVRTVSVVSATLSCSPLHHHAPGQDGQLHGDAAQGVQEPHAALQTQDEECGLDNGKLDIHKNVLRFF